MKITFSFIILTLSKCINTPLLLIETALIGRILGPNVFGEWCLLIAAGTLLHTVLINWTYSITLKFGCEEWTKVKSLSQTFWTRSPILILGLFISFFLLMTRPLDWLTKLYSLNPKLNWLVFLYFISLWLTFEAQSNLQAIHRFSRQAIITPIATCISILFLSSILLNFISGNLLIIVIIVSLSRILSWGWTLISGSKNTNFHFVLPSYNNMKKVIYFGWPLIPTFLCGYLSDWGDHVLLGIFCTTKDVGLWGAAYQMMLAIISLNSIFVTILLPWLVAKNQITKEAPRYYLNEIIPAILSFWLPVLIIVITFFPTLFVFFMGDHFKSANTILLILSFSILTNIFSSLYGILFTVQNRLTQSFFYNFIMICVNLTISLLLIPKFGIIGAAIGTTVSYVIAHFLYVLDHHRLLNIPLDRAGMLFGTALLIGLLEIFSGIHLWSRIFCCMLSLLLLTVTIKKTRSIQSSMIKQYFTGILNPLGYFLEKILIGVRVDESH